MDLGSTSARTIICVVFLLLAGVRITCAEPNPIHDFRIWAPVYLTVPLGESMKGYMEANPRFSDNASTIDQLLVRPALGYQVTPTISLWQGYAWITNYEPGFSQEHRLFQQLIYARKFSDFKIFSRSRLEERWIDDAIGTSLRARTMLRGDIPLPVFPALSLAAYDEIFVNLNSIRQGPESGFDQNRTFVGFNYQFTSQLNMDLGYQLQITNNVRPHLVNNANHVLLLQIFINL